MKKSNEDHRELSVALFERAVNRLLNEGSRPCACGQRISQNKASCLACALKAEREEREAAK